MREDHTLRGTVRFGQDFSPGPDTVMHVQVEAVPYADAAAVVVARLDLPLGAVLDPGAVLPFALPVHDVDTAMRYELRVHVDRSGGGRVEAGDLLSTRSYPVLTQGAPDRVEVTVERV